MSGLSMLRTVRSLALAGVVAASGAAVSGCYVEEEGPPPGYAYGYEPAYYDGYVVYYDGVGRPYYYAGGEVFWVPPTSPVYIGLVNHWRVYRPYYHRWYGHYGYRYRGYRGGAYYRGGGGYHGGGGFRGGGHRR